MPLYYFVLNTGRDSIPDIEGQELGDQTAAREHAVTTARDLMKNRERTTRLWRIEVRDEYLQLCSEVLFSSVDPTIGHLPRTWQNSIDRLSRGFAELTSAMVVIRNTLADTRTMLASAEELLKSEPMRRP